MELQKPNNFEEEWQKAFNDASFAPPSDMWERIEQDLERKKRRPFLFFLRPSAMLAGVAATLVLALGGILFFNQKNSKTPLAEVSESAIKASSKPQNIDSQATSAEINDDNVALAVPSFANPNLSTENKNPKQTLALAQNDINKSVNKPKKSIQNSQLPTLAAASFAGDNVANTAAADTPPTNNQALGSFNTTTADNQTNTSIPLAQNDNKAIPDLALLKYHEYKYLGSRYTLKRNKLVFESEVTEAPVVASNDSKFWVGVQSGVSPFDPNMKLGELNSLAYAQADAFAKNSNTASVGASPSGGNFQNNVMVSQPQNAIRAGVGINTGVAMGYKISKKWNFESGIRYLRGNSTLNSNTYAFQQNGYANTFLADYLLQNSVNQDMQFANKQINTVVADASQFGNRYEYLMIPVQVGYEIGLSKKVALNILAGVSTDIFLQNTIINDNSILQEKSTINTSSNIYKPLNLSGLGGIRASYLVSKHWQLNLGSSYQHSLFSGINNSTALQMRLKMFGLNYGLNYRF
ncbi:MAG: outer membrane beta-barrel protein [Emticicia sp.]|uniref:outer membrane beta-barrel protein n=1 Tax=Emticicia sp. TaxID=1930953 RepID=UPI003BA4D8D5